MSTKIERILEGEDVRKVLEYDADWLKQDKYTKDLEKQIAKKGYSTDDFVVYRDDFAKQVIYVSWEGSSAKLKKFQQDVISIVPEAKPSDHDSGYGDGVSFKEK